MKKLISIRINDRTARQIEELKNSLNETQTGIITLAVEKLYSEEKMRDYQINELEKIADVISNYDTSEATAAEAVEYYEQNEEMPEWYDEHDRGLLIGMVEKIIK